MKYTIYEDPITHRFAHLPLPVRFLDGDRLPPMVIDRWFESHQAAVAALSDLLACDEGESAPAEAPDAAEQVSATPQPIDRPPRPFVWFHH
jgi:hypothetical protein